MNNLYDTSKLSRAQRVALLSVMAMKNDPRIEALIEQAGPHIANKLLTNDELEVLLVLGLRTYKGETHRRLGDLSLEDVQFAAPFKASATQQLLESLEGKDLVVSDESDIDIGGGDVKTYRGFVVKEVRWSTTQLGDEVAMLLKDFNPDET